jgi:ubiquinone/menaquinone biosynthesis C-methylase UbiE
LNLEEAIMSKSAILPSEVMDYYEQVQEANRLLRIGSQVELIRTQELLHRFLPPVPATILDVGGGAGIHAFWLAQQGYNVHLIDAVPRHIEQAKETSKQSPISPLARMAVGDARTLDYPDQFADSVLLFGPLYHLTERSDRIKALGEAFRVLRPSGVALLVGISRFASTVNCLMEGLIADPIFVPIVERDLKDGHHINPTNDPSYFTTTFWHHPDELRQESEEVGFKTQAILAVEGPARLLKDFKDHWQQPEQREWLLKIVRQLESESSLLGFSTHLMLVARKV